MTTGVVEYGSELDRKSLEILSKTVRGKRIEEESKRKMAFDRNAMARRNNQKMLVVRRRPAKNKPGLEFSGLGPWGF